MASKQQCVTMLIKGLTDAQIEALLVTIDKLEPSEITEFTKFVEYTADDYTLVEELVEVDRCTFEKKTNLTERVFFKGIDYRALAAQEKLEQEALEDALEK